MTTACRLRVPLALVALVAVLIGSGAATATEPRSVIRKTVIPAAAFIPAKSSYDYRTGLTDRWLESGLGHFLAPVNLPVPVAKIKRIVLYAYDEDPEDYICAWLVRPSPATRKAATMAEACTADDSADPQAVRTTAISPRWVNTTIQGPYLWVAITGPDVKFYGVSVTYQYDA